MHERRPKPSIFERTIVIVLLAIAGGAIAGIGIGFTTRSTNPPKIILAR